MDTVPSEFDASQKYSASSLALADGIMKRPSLNVASGLMTPPCPPYQRTDGGGLPVAMHWNSTRVALGYANEARLNADFGWGGRGLRNDKTLHV